MHKIANSRDEDKKAKIFRDTSFQRPRCLLDDLVKFDSFLSTYKRGQMLTIATRRVTSEGKYAGKV